MSTQSVDQFLVYGQMYEKITADPFRALEEPSHEIAQVLYIDLNNNQN